ncbi:serine/threonine-protein phosphatase 6 regulatory subunit 3-like isoform X2 [Halichondria panicea]|uniref:serine/threonine-protein phosphatase 6 regulatory subunit 3-like isoform X2 n=1 Tax=Halichondria panicea TaxID=6063 RepID=UPI00312B5B32
MFWRLSFRRPSAIDAILDKEDCTLGEILDEDDVLQECKSHNKKLVDFLVRPEMMEELVKYVCQEPSEDVEDKVKFKYPHIACELLTSEVFTITEQLSASEYLMGLLWSFLDSTGPLNPLVGSFISKVLAMLLNKEPMVIFNFMQGREDFLSQFLVHLGTSAIMDLLLQMVAVAETDQIRQDIAMWLKEQGLVEKLIDFIGKDTDNTEYCANASQALCDMFVLSRESYQKANPAPLLDTLESEETLQRLLDNMFSSETPKDVVIVNGISVLLTALEKRSLPMINTPPPLERSFSMGNPEEGSENSLHSGKELTAELERCLHNRLKDFHDLLSRRPQGYPHSVMSTTAGDLDPPLGNTRLQVVRLFASILQCGSSGISTAMMQLRTFSILVDLFFQYPWNNFLHKEIELCVGAALSSDSAYPPSDQTITAEEEEEAGPGETSPSEDSQSNPKSLRHHLLTECKLVCKILEGFDLNEKLSSESKGRRQGYMGHLIRIINSLVRCGEGDESLREALKISLDEDTQQQWNNFIIGPIAELNKRNETNLGGNAPLSSGMDDSDEEFDQLNNGGIMDSELEKAYQQYQDVRYVTQFMDDCGVEDELNPEREPFEASFSRLMDLSSHIEADEEPPVAPGMFDAACASRIQQFDDDDESDDEEEDTSTWTDKEVSLSSPMDHNSGGSSDEEDSFTRRREFPTGSSDEDESPGKRAAPYMTTPPGRLTQITSSLSKEGDSDKMEIGMISWRSELSTDAELSGGGVVDSTDGGINWITEPMSAYKKDQEPDSPNSTNWADFSSAFPNSTTTGQEEHSSPQDMDLDSAHVSSHITVTYKRAGGDSPYNDDDIIESPEHIPNKASYSLLSPSGATNEIAPSSPLDMDTIQLAVDTSSDEDVHSSSDSDDERSGKYAPVNTSTSSDAEALIGNDDSQEPSSSADDTASEPQGTSSANNDGGTSHSNSLEGEARGTECNSNQDENRLGDTDGMDEGQLQDNYSFLSKQGMLSANSSSNNNSGGDVENDRLRLEQKRAEAVAAMEQWDQEASSQSSEGLSLDS